LRVPGKEERICLDIRTVSRSTGKVLRFRDCFEL